MAEASSGHLRYIYRRMVHKRTLSIIDRKSDTAARVVTDIHEIKELHITPVWSLLAKFESEFASGSQTDAGTGSLG
jgi:hypothetical protein